MLGSQGGPENSRSPLGIALLLTPSLLLGVSFVVLMVSIHYYAPEERKIWSHTGLTFATIYATLITIVYFVHVLPRKQWLLYGNYFANYFPESYWGISPFTKDSDELPTIYTQVHIEQQALHRIEPGLFTGPALVEPVQCKI